MDKESYQAVVQKVVHEGKHGPYVVTKCEAVETGTVTFSYDEETWHEKKEPKPGNVVLISGVIKKRAGWRATSARFLEPADEQTANRKEQ